MIRPTIDVAELPEIAFTERSPLWWGAIGMLAIEATMFGLLMSAYVYLRLRQDIWPPAGVSLPHLFLPTLNLIIMILSCLPSYYASEAAKANSPTGMKFWLLLNVILALITVGIRWDIWNSLNYSGRSNAYGSIVWTILGFHTFDYVAGILESIGILVLLFAGYAGNDIRKAVDFDSYTWYFVVAIWIPLYAVVFVWPLFPKF